jgi:hypothetical protein
VFGGYDGRRNHNTLHFFNCGAYRVHSRKHLTLRLRGARADTRTWSVCKRASGRIPEGRNGHTATLASRKVYVLGGWLGSGPLASADMYVLDVGELC